MPLSVDINAPIDVVFKILDDSTLNSAWNPVIDKITVNQPGQCSVESFMGNFTTSKVAVKDQSVTIKIVGNPVLKQLTYDLVSLSPTRTRVHGNVTLDGPGHYTTMHSTVGRALLDGLKKYVEQNWP